MKFLYLMILILITACNSSNQDMNVNNSDYDDTTPDTRFEFINHQMKTLDITSVIESHAEHMPFYIKLTTQNNANNVYLGEITYNTDIDKITTYLPLSETRIHFEIFNINGYVASGHLDI